MSTVVSAKRCPECGAAAGLPTTVCADCGHRFRTRFAEALPPPDTLNTDAFRTLILAGSSLRCIRATRKFGAAFLSGFLPVACVCALGWGLWSAGHAPAKSSHRLLPAPAVYSPAERARQLYEKIGMAMSLYDVDQAAGGTGHVVQVRNPHTLLLLYREPGWKVWVRLSRADVAGDDYRVQAVALDHGETRLARRAYTDGSL